MIYKYNVIKYFLNLLIEQMIIPNNFPNILCVIIITIIRAHCYLVYKICIDNLFYQQKQWNY